MPTFCKPGRVSWVKRDFKSPAPFSAAPLHVCSFHDGEACAVCKATAATEPYCIVALFAFCVAISCNICVSWRCSDRLIRGLLATGGAYHIGLQRRSVRSTDPRERRPRVYFEQWAASAAHITGAPGVVAGTSSTSIASPALVSSDVLFEACDAA